MILHLDDEQNLKVNETIGKNHYILELNTDPIRHFRNFLIVN